MFVPQLVCADKQAVIRAQYDGADYFFRKEEANIRDLLETFLSEDTSR
jgi:hypothetical protein